MLRVLNQMADQSLVALVLLCVYASNALAQVININNGICGQPCSTAVAVDECGNGPPETLCSTKRPNDCQDVYDYGSRQTGNYTIYPEGTGGIQVRCDMSDPTGAWTVFQRRISNTDFYKTWDEYKYGFGNLSENFWLGNRQLHIITAQGWNELKVDMEFSNSTKAYAIYRKFEIADDDDNFKLSVGEYHGNAGDSLSFANGRGFTTHDNDNDIYGSNCAQKYHGAWWYTACHQSNLNGVYDSTEYGKGMNWLTLTGHYQSLAKTEMKVRKFIKRT